MRKGLQNLENNENNNYKIIAVDDEEGIIDSLSIFLKRSAIILQVLQTLN